MCIQLSCKVFVSKNLLNAGLSIIKISVNSYYKRIGTFLSPHLQFLYAAHAILRIKYDDLCTRNICKSCHGSLSCISGCGCQDHDLILHMVFLRCCRHKIRKNGQRHIFECDGLSVEQFQIISTAGFHKRGNFFCVKFFIIRMVNAVLQFFFCKVGQELLHDRVSCLLIRHLCQRFDGYIQSRNHLRNK